MTIRRYAVAAVVLTAALACSAPDQARTSSARSDGASGPSAHGPGASPDAARPTAPGGSPRASGAPGNVPGRSGARAGGTPLLAALRDPHAFDAKYAVSGEIVVSWLGIDKEVAPPAVAVSTWEDLIATTWVRGRTAYGQVGFSFGYTDHAFRRLDHVILYVPSSRDASRPSDGYVDLPLARGLPWLSARVGETLTAPTKDGRWDVALRWTDPRTLTLAMTPRPGADTPSYFTEGTLTVTTEGPAAAPWRALGVRVDMTADGGTITGDLAAVPR